MHPRLLTAPLVNLGSAAAAVTIDWVTVDIPTSDRGLRGGDFTNSSMFVAASTRGLISPSLEADSVGFRVASLPEPATGMLAIAGVLGLSIWRRRRA